jgi:hypothetical protein
VRCTADSLPPAEYRSVTYTSFVLVFGASSDVREIVSSREVCQNTADLDGGTRKFNFEHPSSPEETHDCLTLTRCYCSVIKKSLYWSDKFRNTTGSVLLFKKHSLPSFVTELSNKLWHHL